MTKAQLIPGPRPSPGSGLCFSSVVGAGCPRLGVKRHPARSCQPDREEPSSPHAASLPPPLPVRIERSRDCVMTPSGVDEQNSRSVSPRAHLTMRAVPSRTAETAKSVVYLGSAGMDGEDRRYPRLRHASGVHPDTMVWVTRRSREISCRPEVAVGELVLGIGGRITGDHTRGHRNHPNRGR